VNQKPPDPSGKAPELSDEQAESLEQAWDALEQGEVDEALSEAEELKRETRGHPEVRLLLGAALLEVGEAEDALRELELARGRVSDEVLWAFYLAGANFELARLGEAEDLLRNMIASEPEEPAGVYGLAEVLEHLGKPDEAEDCYRRAHQLDPENYPMPMRLTREAFQEVVAEASATLPEELREHLELIPVVVQDLPAEEALDPSLGATVSPGVLGLFVGRSLREESVFEAPETPRTIYIYQRNLERACDSREELVDEIATTFYHELGHYLGLDENDLEERDLN
jgi:predicted Zn-dependent protease with MMP-like domain/predicted negative regulator of RcsB-dependent stress response